jgi:hypothetical protein
MTCRSVPFRHVAIDVNLTPGAPCIVNRGLNTAPRFLHGLFNTCSFRSATASRERNPDACAANSPVAPLPLHHSETPLSRRQLRRRSSTEQTPFTQASQAFKQVKLSLVIALTVWFVRSFRNGIVRLETISLKFERCAADRRRFALVFDLSDLFRYRVDPRLS